MTDWSERRRTIRWGRQMPPDPTLSGLEGLRAVVDGTRPVPPAAALIGLRAQSVEHGRVRMALTPAEYHYNPLGSVHGGVIATVLDTVLACAVLSTLPPGQGCVTVEIKVNYLRALTEAVGEVVGEGVCTHAGRQVGVAEGRVTDAKGRVFAVASTTLLVFDLLPGREMVDGGVRERVVTWGDPAMVDGGLSGVEYLRAARDGHAARAPVSALLGFDLVEVEPGRVSMSLVPGEHMENGGGSMHGGMMATLLDSVMGCAVHSTLPAGRGYTTLEIKVNYLRAVTGASGLMTAVGQVVHGDGKWRSRMGGRRTKRAGCVPSLARPAWCSTVPAQPNYELRVLSIIWVKGLASMVASLGPAAFSSGVCMWAARAASLVQIS